MGWTRFGGKSAVCVPQQGYQPLYVLQRDLIWPETEHATASESCGEVFLQIGVEAGGSVVAAVQPDASLDLNQHTGLHVRKIDPPTPLVMDAVFSLSKAGPFVCFQSISKRSSNREGERAAR